MQGIDLLHIRIFFLYSQLISKIAIFWCNVDDFTVFLLLQNSSDFEICSLMRDNDIMLNINFFSVYKSSCMCRIPTQTYCKILLSMCMAMCMCISCNIYVALGARGLKEITPRKKFFLGKINLLLNFGDLDENNDVKHNIFRCLILQMWMILV